MQPLDRLWFNLESIPGRCVLRSEWEGRLGHEYPLVQRFLRPTDMRSRSHPCPGPGGDGCPRQVVFHGPGDVVAVCGESPRRCETIVLTENELVLYEFDLRAFCHELAELLDVEPRFEPVAEAVQTWVVGVRSRRRSSDFLVYLTLPLSPEDLRQATSRLVATTREAFLLLAPTEKHRDLTTRDLLQHHGCHFHTLKALLAANDAGPLVATSTTLEVFEGLEPPLGGEGANLFQRRGKAWIIRFEDKEFPLPDRKGLRYLSPLLRDPERDFHLTELEAAAGEILPVTSEEASTARLGVQLPSDDLDSSGRMLDAKAVASYRERLRKIEQEIAQAKVDRDLASQEKLTRDQMFIEEQLLAAQGLHGRSRPSQNRLKRTRDRITVAVNRALDEIRKHHPDLAQHLDGSLIRGTHWSYRPRPPVDWIV